MKTKMCGRNSLRLNLPDDLHRKLLTEASRQYSTLHATALRIIHNYFSRKKGTRRGVSR